MASTLAFLEHLDRLVEDRGPRLTIAADAAVLVSRGAFFLRLPSSNTVLAVDGQVSVFKGESNIFRERKILPGSGEGSSNDTGYSGDSDMDYSFDDDVSFLKKLNEQYRAEKQLLSWPDNQRCFD
jgi:hypothetical protein